MRKHQYFKVPQLQRYNLDHSRLGGSGDHSETGEETECSCRPGHNRSLQVSCRGLNKGQSMYQSLLVVMLPGEARKKRPCSTFFIILSLFLPYRCYSGTSLLNTFDLKLET